MRMLDRSKTALVVIDLQKGILARPLRPYDAADVLKKIGQAGGALPRGGGACCTRHCGLASRLPRRSESTCGRARPAKRRRAAGRLRRDRTPHLARLMGTFASSSGNGADFTAPNSISSSVDAVSIRLFSAVSQRTLGLNRLPAQPGSMDMLLFLPRMPFPASATTCISLRYRTFFPRIGCVGTVESIVASLPSNEA